MRDIFPYIERHSYPHMKPYDVAIWERFISQFPDMYNYVQYDFEVGSGPMFDTLVDPDTGSHVEALYKRKIDVVGHKEGQIDIIECKPKAGPSAVGQVKMYKALYIRDENPAVEPKAIIITDELLPDMAEYAATEGVLIVVV